MICPKCSTLNDDNNAFCVNCGAIFPSSASIPPTILPNFSSTETPTQILPTPPNQNNESVSEPTVFGGQQPPFYNQPPGNFNPPPAGFQQSQANFQPSMAGYNPSIPFMPPQAPPKSRLGLWVGLSVFFILLVGGAITGAVLLLNKTPNSKEALPDHLGMFFQNNGKTSVEEIKKQDLTNALEGTDKLLKDDSMPAVESR